MKSHLQIHRIETHTDEWYDFRMNGIGGSEMATVLGINKYDTAVRLYHEKIGTIAQRKEDSERMFWGRTNEDIIAKIWQYYDGSKDGYIENYKNDKIVRTCRRINGYVTHPDYPWLIASLDRVINIKDGFNLITGEPLQTEAVLECKNLGYWMSQMWQDGIPIYFLVQIHVYMLILETDYAEIAMLVDGGNFVVEKVMRDESLIERIVEISKHFWYERVLPGKEARQRRDMADAEGNLSEIDRMDAIIQRLEPDPDDTEAYKDFMEEKFLKERVQVDGNMQLYHMARKDSFLIQMKNRIDSERSRVKNTFIQFMSRFGAEVVDFGKLGTVTWQESKGKASRTFYNRIKDKPGEDYIDQEFNKLDYNNY